MSGPPGNLRLVGNYQVVHALDPAGSMGEQAFLAVKRGARPGDGEPLRVLKVYSGDPGERRHLLLKLPRLHRLRHPTTTHVIECFDEGDRLVLVFEHHDGLSLTQIGDYLEREHERLADAAIWFIAHQLLGALAEAHAAVDEAGKAAPIVHGHLGPDTVHVDWDGSVRIIGLGLGPLMHAAAPEFAAPREVVDKGGVAVDVYAAAIILWSLLSGRRPSSPIPSLDTFRSDVPAVVAEAIEQVLHSAPQRRPIGCRDIQERLEESKKVVSEPAELRWNMELLRAASLFSQPSGGGRTSAPEAPEPKSSSLPGLESLADESTSEGATKVTRQHYMRGPSDSQSFFDPETTLPVERIDSDGEPTLLVPRQLLPAHPPLPQTVAATLPDPPPFYPPVQPPRPDPSRLAVTMQTRTPYVPQPRASQMPLLAIVLAGGLIAAASFTAGWLLKPAAAPVPTASAAQEEHPEPEPTTKRVADVPPSAPPVTAASEDGLPPVRPPSDPKPLSPAEGYLVVRSPVEAFVYVQGVERGRTNEKVRTLCDTRFVRLRRTANNEWIGEGGPVAILCGATTTITIKP